MTDNNKTIFGGTGLIMFLLVFLWIYDLQQQKKGEVKGENGVTYTSYREACRNADFNAAHVFLDRMKKELDKEYSYDLNKQITEAEDFIFNNEANYLVSLNTEEANMRVIYLLNEIIVTPTPLEEWVSDIRKLPCARFNNRCNHILNLAISVGNQDMAKAIIPVYVEDVILDESDHVSGYSYSSKEAAQKKYDEAFPDAK